MRRNRSFNEWYDDMKDRIARSLSLIAYFGSREDGIKDKKQKCKSFEQRLFFERDIEEAIRNKILYKRIAARYRGILMDGINVHYARSMSRGLNINEIELGSKRKDYLAAAFISREILITQINELHGQGGLD